IFLQVTDPVGAGLIANLAKPGGNITGFTTYEYSMSGKWLELLKDIAPAVTRALVLRELNANGIAQLAAIQALAPLLGVELHPADHARSTKRSALLLSWRTGQTATAA